MKDQTIHPTTLKTTTPTTLAADMDEYNDFHNASAALGSRVKLDWSPSSPISCHDSVNNDTDSSPISVGSIVMNTFNDTSSQQLDSDSEECNSLDLYDSPLDTELDEWTLISPRSVHSNNHNNTITITQVPLKSKSSCDEWDDNVHSISYPPKKRQKRRHVPHQIDTTATAATTATATDTRKTKVSFKELVDVIPIPTRDDYSPEVRAQLWSSIMEIQENAARNTIEFASEGWDWRKVILDTDMCQCTTTGEPIHPVHCYNNNNNVGHIHNHHQYLVPQVCEEE